MKKYFRLKRMKGLAAIALAFLMAFSSAGFAMAERYVAEPPFIEFTPGRVGIELTGPGEYVEPPVDYIVPDEGDYGEDEDTDDDADNDVDAGGYVYEDAAVTETYTETETAKSEFTKFPGMPEGYLLSPDEKNLKSQLTTEGVIAGFSETTPDLDYIEGEVVFLSDSESYAKAGAAAYGGDLENYADGVAVIKLSEEVTAFEAVSAAADMGSGLPPVFPNYIYRAPMPVDDEQFERAENVMESMNVYAPTKTFWSPDFKDAFLTNINGANYPWHHEIIGTYAAWNSTMGKGVTVAVLDSGLMYSHQDFFDDNGKNTNVITPGRNTTKGMIIGNTLVNNDPDNVVTDRDGHGTHVAGIVAAKANSYGSRGVAPEARILPVKVLDYYNGGAVGTTATITRGVSWVVNNGSRRADVINMSLGGSIPYDLASQKIITDAIARGIVVVAAAGNDGTNNRVFPASIKGVICVASVDRNSIRSVFSNFGPQVTIAAPGTKIISTYIGSNYSYTRMGGTSMAAPVVSGVVALYISMFGRPYDASGVANVVSALNKSAVKTDSKQIGKVVNVAAMFDKEVAPPDVFQSGSNVVIKTTRNEDFIVYTVDGSNPTVKNGVVTVGTAKSQSSETIPLSSLPAGSVTIKAISVNGQGAVSKATSLTINNTVSKTVITEVSITNAPRQIALGNSVTLKAATVPSKPKPAGVDWSVSVAGYADCSELGVVISTSGKLTIPKALPAAVKEVVVKAAAKADPKVFTTVKIQITGDKSAGVIISTGDRSGRVVWKGGSAATVNMFTANPATATIFDGGKNNMAVDESKIKLNASGASFFTWATSNGKVATVDANGNVTATGPGKANITATASDGSGKKASCSIVVTVPASSLTVQSKGMLSSDGFQSVAIGKSAQLSAALGTAYGAKVTNNKVDWSLNYYQNGRLTYDSRVSVNQSGKVSINGKLPFYNNSFIIVTARALDGSNVYGQLQLYLVPGAVNMEFGAKQYEEVNRQVGFSGYIFFKYSGVYSTDFAVTSSNPGVCAVKYAGSAGSGWGAVQVTKTGNGTSTLKVTATDGSGKSASTKITFK